MSTETSDISIARYSICVDDRYCFRGEWQCRNCFNRNWITIDRTGPTLECQICKQTVPAPVSGDWHFRPNGFVLEAYREHGVEAVIWTLWRLWQSCRRSFYFAPSMWLWQSYPESRDQGPDAEVDALAVADGRLYLCEAKSAAGMDREQLLISPLITRHFV